MANLTSFLYQNIYPAALSQMILNQELNWVGKSTAMQVILCWSGVPIDIFSFWLLSHLL